MPIQTDSIPLW